MSPIWLPDPLRCITLERNVENRYLAFRTIPMVGLKRLLLHTPLPVSKCTDAPRYHRTAIVRISGAVLAHVGPFKMHTRLINSRGLSYAVSELSRLC